MSISIDSSLFSIFISLFPQCSYYSWHSDMHNIKIPSFKYIQNGVKIHKNVSSAKLFWIERSDRVSFFSNSWKIKILSTLFPRCAQITNSFYLLSFSRLESELEHKCAIFYKKESLGYHSRSLYHFSIHFAIFHKRF